MLKLCKPHIPVTHFEERIMVYQGTGVISQVHEAIFTGARVVDIDVCLDICDKMKVGEC